MAEVIYIADLHLESADSKKIALLKSFLLERVIKSAEALYILGDLFEFWIGDDMHLPPDLGSVLKAIRAVADSGTEVHLLHGNRDFLVGQKFADKCGINLHTEDELVVKHLDEQILLLHGDTLCLNDLKYQEMLKMLRNPEWQSNFLSLSIKDRIKQAEQLRQRSIQEVSEKSYKDMEIPESAIMPLVLKYNATNIIHGHTHDPDIHTGMVAGQVVSRFVVGDWSASQGSFCSQRKGGKFVLENWV